MRGAVLLIAVVALVLSLSSAQASDRVPADPEARRLVSEVQQATARVQVAVEQVQASIEDAARSMRVGAADEIADR